MKSVENEIKVKQEIHTEYQQADARPLMGGID